MHVILDLVATYGYIVVLLVVMSESAGLPVPGETSLLVASAIAATGRLSIIGVVAAAALGAILGDTAGYWVGRRFGLALLQRHGRWLRIDDARLRQGETFFARHGEKTVFLGRFIPVGRVFSALLAGVSHMPYRRFLVWNAAGGIVWASLMGTLGYLFGTQLPLIERIVQRSGLALLLAIVAVVVMRSLILRRKQVGLWWARLLHSDLVRRFASAVQRIGRIGEGARAARTTSWRRAVVVGLAAGAAISALVAAVIGVAALDLM